MKCRICGCTEDRACGTGCCWVADEEEQTGPICNQCVAFRDKLVRFIENTGRRTLSDAGMRRLLTEAKLILSKPPASRRTIIDLSLPNRLALKALLGAVRRDAARTRRKEG